MKNKIYVIILLLGLLHIFTACDPLTEEGVEASRFDATKFQPTVTQVIVDGIKTNKVKCETSSPVYCKWKNGVSYTVGNSTELLLFATGEQTVTATFTDMAGNVSSKEFTIEVDELYFPVPAQWGYLCGTGEKKWVWDSTGREDGKIWGNGGYRAEFGPGWWGRTVDDIDEEDAYEEYGGDAYMTFMLDNATIIKSSANGAKSEKGAFSFDMTKTIDNEEGGEWAIGEFSTSGMTILQGISQNEDKMKVYSFWILQLDDDKMVLCRATGDQNNGAWSEGWFWMFKAAE